MNKKILIDVSKNVLKRFRTFQTFETPVGIKYNYPVFNSNSFADYRTRSALIQDISYDFDDFILCPDGLRNVHTWCGKPIMESPHFRMMYEIDNGNFSHSSEYIRHCQAGTLDARQPFTPDIHYLRNKFELSRSLSRRGQYSDVFVYEIPEDKKLIIMDGKHRLALAAYFQSPHSMRVHFVARTTLNHKFFRKLYRAILQANSVNYSINQHVIGAMQNECTATGDSNSIKANSL